MRLYTRRGVTQLCFESQPGAPERAVRRSRLHAMHSADGQWQQAYLRLGQAAADGAGLAHPQVQGHVLLQYSQRVGSAGQDCAGVSSAAIGSQPAGRENKVPSAACGAAAAAVKETLRLQLGQPSAMPLLSGTDVCRRTSTS
jgi:hypothetical protein